MKNFYIFFIVIFFVGCGKTTTALNHFDKDIESAKSIQYTKKSDITYKDEINSILFATYLNNVDEKYESESINNFIVGVHIINKENQDFVKNGYVLTLNDENTLNLIEIDFKSNDFSKLISLKNPWAKYYLVDFENKKDIKSLNLKLSHPEFGSTSLNFQK